MKNLTIIYVYYNTPSELSDSVRSLNIKSGYKNVEIIVVDNNSPRPIPSELIKNENVVIIKNRKNKGFGNALNQASLIARGNYLLFLNPDTMLPKDFIDQLINKMKADKKIGLLGVRYINENGKSIKSVGGFPSVMNILFSFSFLARIFPKSKQYEEYWMTKFNYTKESEVPVIGGACMLVRSSLFKKIKGFDPQFFMYFEEADLSERIRLAGYKVVYYPDITITHLVGKSTNDKKWIKKRFEESRYKIVKKYNGKLKALLAEGIIRYVTAYNVLLFFIISISLFLNLYKLQQLMMFYGDFGRDYLAARDIFLTGNIPLRGIPSSVVWLHQGPLSIYFIGFSFLVSNFNPIAPAIFYAILGVLSTFLVYIIGKEYFNRSIGTLAALIYATSPLIVINARMPYHTASIPFFTLILFLVLKKVLNGNNKLLPLLFFIYGLLFQLELSNSLLFLVIVIVFVFFKIKLKKIDILKAFIGFLIGILPFIVYDIQNNFIQTGGFVLWVINRVSIFVGLRGVHTASGNIFSATSVIWEEVNRLVFPHSSLLVSIITVVTILTLIIRLKDILTANSKSIVILIWVVVPLVGFLIHSKPGVAYTPVLFPGITLILAFTFYNLIKLNKIFLLLLFVLVFLNFTSLLANNYYLTSEYTSTRPKLFNYSYGLDLALRLEVANAIVNDAKNKEFSVYGGGYLGKIGTGVDNYKYLLWQRGGKISELGALQYRIYEIKKEIKNKNKIIFQNKYLAVTKNE